MWTTWPRAGASIARPTRGRVYNLTRRRAGAGRGGHGLCRRTAGHGAAAGNPFDETTLSPMAKRFWGGVQAGLQRQGQGRAGLAADVSTYREGAGGGSGGGRLRPAGLCTIAAATKLANRGCGAKGRLFSSGWNWTPTNQGWSSRSTISGSDPVGRQAAELQARALDRLAVADVDLVAVAVALGDAGRAVDLGDL